MLAELKPTFRDLRDLRSFLREQPRPADFRLMLKRELVAGT